MNVPNLTIQQLLEAGVHLGHKTFRWNPKMKKYIFGKKNSIHIIDLVQTLDLTKEALSKVSNVVENGGKILFVSTKKQAAESIASLAKDTSQYYVNYRWLGGMLTNWKTISNSIKKLKNIYEALKGENIGFTKKEILKMKLKRDKLEKSLGGISEMKGIPDLIFIIDTNYEKLAIKEATKLNIPIVAVLDTNSDPTGIDYPIPGNDDARRAINLYCDLLKQTIYTAQDKIKTSHDKNIKIENPKKEIKTEEKKEHKKMRLIDKLKEKVVSKISKKKKLEKK
jgi:small subunit ribosomal protein S2